jgi:hypothetical protein
VGCLLCAKDWLYDEGEDETKAVYEAKLKELEALGEPLLGRAREAEARPAAAAALASTAHRLASIAAANDAKHAHIPQEDKDKVCVPPPRNRQSPLIAHTPLLPGTLWPSRPPTTRSARRIPQKDKDKCEFCPRKPTCP